MPSDDAIIVDWEKTISEVRRKVKNEFKPKLISGELSVADYAIAVILSTDKRIRVLKDKHTAI